MSTPPAVLSLDIGGTKLAVGVVTSDGRVHGLIVEPTHRDEGPEAVIARLFDMGHRAVADAALDTPIAAVGISCGGPLDGADGVLLCPPHLPGWIDIPLGSMVLEEFGVPAFLENDATAAALGEHRFGAGVGTSTMLYLTVSTGVGGGSVVHGRLHRGAAGNGGELGHIMVRPGGRLCTCGRRGCLEAYVSGTAIAERAAEALESTESPALAGASPLTAASVSAAARDGDPLAERIWAETTDILGQALTDLVNMFEPELVVLGGGVTRSGAMLLDPVTEAVARDAMAPAAKAVQVVLAKLGDVVCVVGAGVVALDALAEVSHA
ncbi:ROK family protein [Phytoactinopolyspora halotolerans]|uniref:ROK family protein n=1 Tax=Phytoactinopolyspora halotolerans TaxID=1981512 RepID=A0A6L9S3T3_9ACTN|nr:ROK family protein [Phytoactinopolyspora halotolerans]NED99323.1 ROK family protein [Phytoactinopolyspora halotolerans]